MLASSAYATARSSSPSLLSCRYLAAPTLARVSYSSHSQSEQRGRSLWWAAGGLVAAGALSAYYSKGVAEENSKNPPVALSPDEFRAFKLESIEDVNHNTKVFRFALPTEDSVLGLTVASCLVVRAPGQDGKPVVRPYTPINVIGTQGHCDLLIKEYPEGNVSKHVHQMKVGDTLEFKGPFGKLEYKANMKSHIVMVAGGTGITPMLQVLQHALADPEDRTMFTLLFANVEERDILLKDTLDSLVSEHPARFKVIYTLDKADPEWKDLRGHIDDEKLAAYCPHPSDDVLICVCGPPPMVKAIAGEKGKNNSQGEVGGALKRLGYSESMVYKF